MKTDFNILHDQFLGVRALANNYTVVGAPAAASGKPGFVFTNGDAIHWGGALQLDPTLLSKVMFEVHNQNTDASDNTVPAAHRLVFGLINAAYAADPVAAVGITKYLLFEIEGASSEVHVMASDGVTTYDEYNSIDLDDRSREFEIDLASGVEDILFRVGGRPAVATNKPVALALTAADVMQPVFIATGADIDVTLSQLLIRGRRSLLK